MKTRNVLVISKRNLTRIFFLSLFVLNFCTTNAQWNGIGNDSLFLPNCSTCNTSTSGFRMAVKSGSSAPTSINDTLAVVCYGASNVVSFSFFNGNSSGGNSVYFVKQGEYSWVGCGTSNDHCYLRVGNTFTSYAISTTAKTSIGTTGGRVRFYATCVVGGVTLTSNPVTVIIEPSVTPTAIIGVIDSICPKQIFTFTDTFPNQKVSNSPYLNYTHIWKSDSKASLQSVASNNTTANFLSLNPTSSIITFTTTLTANHSWGTRVISQIVCSSAVTKTKLIKTVPSFTIATGKNAQQTCKGTSFNSPSQITANQIGSSFGRYDYQWYYVVPPSTTPITIGTSNTSPSAISPKNDATGSYRYFCVATVSGGNGNSCSIISDTTEILKVN